MSEYIPFLVIASFAVVLYFGTIIWTELLFPEKNVAQQAAKQEEFNFKNPEQKDSPSALVSSPR